MTTVSRETTVAAPPAFEAAAMPVVSGPVPTAGIRAVRGLLRVLPRVVAVWSEICPLRLGLSRKDAAQDSRFTMGTFCLYSVHLLFVLHNVSIV